MLSNPKPALPDEVHSLVRVLVAVPQLLPQLCPLRPPLAPESVVGWLVLKNVFGDLGSRPTGTFIHVGNLEVSETAKGVTLLPLWIQKHSGGDSVALVLGSPSPQLLVISVSAGRLSTDILVFNKTNKEPYCLAPNKHRFVHSPIDPNCSFVVSLSEPLSAARFANYRR